MTQTMSMVFWMISMLSLMIITTLCTCLAFDSPATIATTPAKNSLSALFGSDRENKNEDYYYSYDVFGKIKTSKRRRLKNAARRIARSLKDKRKFSGIDNTNGDGLLSETESENHTTSKKGQRKTAPAKHEGEELPCLLRNPNDSDGDRFIDNSEFDRSVRDFAASPLRRASHGTAKRRVELDGDNSIREEDAGKASLSSHSSSFNDDDDDDNGTNPLDRRTMRLSGFDPYILVSVLTAGASFDVINGHHPEWDVLGSKSSLLALTTQDWLMSAILVTAGASTVMGIYAAVVFSLTVLYGRTALGMNADQKYDRFLERTGLQRYRGFRAFSGSLGLFCLLVIFELFKKSAGVFRLPIVVASVAILYFGKQEYDTIIEAAGPIFVSNDDGDDGDDDR
uniref:Calmodulin n=1 Tax=Pseudo-nitzschia australis TaxID=44445 RepID=A0A7S4ALL7_9STRA